MGFSQPEDASFEWRDAESGSEEVAGKSIATEDVTGGRGMLDEGGFFEKQGFRQDVHNGADGVEGGQQGFSKGKTVCLFEYMIKGEDKDSIEKDNLIYDIKISCAQAS